MTSNTITLTVHRNDSSISIVTKQQLQDELTKCFGDTKGHTILEQLYDCLIGSTVPLEGFYPWDLNKAFALLNIPVIFVNEEGKQQQFAEHQSGIS